QKSDTTSELSVLFEALGKVWSLGLSPDWRAVFGSYTPLSDLPNYAYDRRYHWLSPPCDENPNGSASNSFEKRSHKVNDTRMRKQLLINKVRDILDQASGITIEDHAIHDNFVEMGFDSLLLTQIAQALKKEFNVPITFRKLNEECSSLERLADFLDQHLPMDQFSLETLSKANSTTVPPLTGNHPPIDAINTATPGTADSMVLLSQQISLLSQQIALLRAGQTSDAQAGAVPLSTMVHKPKEVPFAELSNEELTKLRKPFGATARIDREVSELSLPQQAFLNEFISNYVSKTAKSKAYNQE